VEALRLLVEAVRKRRTPGVILVRFKEAGLPEEDLR
jgi:hypothetical protein